MSEYTTPHTHTPDSKRLQRSRSDRMVAGVSGGLARYFEIHPAVFRVGFVVLTLIGGAGILIYAAAALVMPDEGKVDSVASAALRDRRDRPWPVIGLGLLAIAGAALASRVTLWPHGDAWFLFLLAGALILWVTRHPAADSTVEGKELAARDSSRIGRIFGALAVAIASLIVVGAVAVGVFLAVFDVHFGDGTGERKVSVRNTAELKDEYLLGIGKLHVDLTGVTFPVGETHLNARVDVGDLRLTVPEDVAVRVHGTARVGEVTILERNDNGHHAVVDLVETGERVLVIDAHVGLGAVNVDRVVR